MGNFTLLVFPFQYSALGKLVRTPLPAVRPLETIKWSHFFIRHANIGPLAWMLFKEGIGIKIEILGDVFLPLEEIDTIELGAGFMDYMSVVCHHCPELRGPLQVPNHVAQIMAAYYPDKLLVPAEAAEEGR